MDVLRVTRGLWELLNRKAVDKRLVTAEDLAEYKDIGFNQRTFGGI